MIDSDIPSKSARKRESTDLQVLGEALIDLPQSELEALPLPEILRDAVELARRITAHGGLSRQKQYIGKLMRKIDAEPIRAALQARKERDGLEARRFRRTEVWRDRIVSEGRPAAEQFVAEFPGDINAAELVALAQRAERERQENRPPAAARELFRKLREAMQEP